MDRSPTGRHVGDSGLNLIVKDVRRQHTRDKLADLDKGGFLVHRINTKNRNESQI